MVYLVNDSTVEDGGQEVVAGPLYVVVRHVALNQAKLITRYLNFVLSKAVNLQNKFSCIDFFYLKIAFLIFRCISLLTVFVCLLLLSVRCI